MQYKEITSECDSHDHIMRLETDSQPKCLFRLAETELEK